MADLIFAYLSARVKKYLEFGVASGFGTPQACPGKGFGLGFDKRASPPQKNIFENIYLEDPAAWMKSSSTCYWLARDRRQAQAI